MYTTDTCAHYPKRESLAYAQAKYIQKQALMWVSGMHGTHADQGHLVSQLFMALSHMHHPMCHVVSWGALYMHNCTPKPRRNTTAQQIIKAMKLAPAPTRLLKTYSDSTYVCFNISTGVYSSHVN